jgi:hypothetical protein
MIRSTVDRVGTAWSTGNFATCGMKQISAPRAAATFSGGREHAIVSLKDGTRAIVKGGERGMKIPADTRRLIVHTHPYHLGASGPSIHDINALKSLGQVHSYLLERCRQARFGRGR